MFSYLRIPTDVAVAERQQRDLPQPKDHFACLEIYNASATPKIKDDPLGKFL